VEYARGFIPLSMPFGIAEEIFVCCDLLTVAQTVSLYTDLTAQAFGHKLGILKPFTKPVSCLAHKVTKALEPTPQVKEIPKKNIRWFQKQN
jgi:hypothetical protein